MTIQRNGKRSWIATLVLGACLLYPLPANPITGDDIFLLSTSVSPNVVLLFDNSRSTRHIEWHRNFDPDAGAYGCSDFINSVEYMTAGNSDFLYTACGKTQWLFTPDVPTLYDGRYLNWYFGNATASDITEIETKTAKSVCNKAEEFNQMYRRTRFQTTQHVLIDLLCIAETKGIRFSLAQFRDPEDALGEDPNGGYLTVDLGRSNPNHATELESKIKNLDIGSETPLAEALFQIYTFYMPRNPALTPVGADGATQFPTYWYAKDGDWETNSNKWMERAVEFACEKSFVVILTDGVPSRDDFDEELVKNQATGFTDFDKLIGDYNPDGQIEEPGDVDETSWYLDDIAMFMQENDYRPDLVDDQLIDTYTVGFATDNQASAFLQKTADVGNGLFFKARDGEELAQSLILALNDIVEKSQSFTAASVPSARTADGGDFYQSYFFPRARSAFWEGHLRAWKIAANGDILDANLNCAVDDADPGECNSGPFLPSAVYFWDAAEQVPPPGASNGPGFRTLYTSKVSGGTPTMVDFDDALDAADLTIEPFVAAPDPAPNSSRYPSEGSTALNAEGLADEVVAYGRGCFFGTGVGTSDVATPATCLERPATLGDVFHSNPVVVRRPRALINEPSYAEFKTTYGARSRVIYAGTNGGFLHAFDAGAWQQPAGLPPYYDAGTGRERFGFMPWEPRQNIKNQPVDPVAARTYYVDGSPQVADAWFPSSPTAASKASNGREWHTVLVGGLRQGGHHFYALDITNPDNINAPGGKIPYPDYLWEFPREDDPNDPANPNSFLPWMGETWSQPIITRVRLRVAGDDNNGMGYERWVAVVTGGNATDGNPNDPANWDSINGKAGRSIFIIDLQTGEVLAEKKFDLFATDAQMFMYSAIPATATVLDLDFDGFADVIYVGDLYGILFKWVIREIGEDRVHDGSGVRTQPSWPYSVFFVANPQWVAASGTTHYKSIFFSPAATFVNSTLWLAFGTGERDNVAFTGEIGKDEDNNRFYVVSDTDPYETNGPNPILTDWDLLDMTGLASASITGRGFYLVGRDGEKWVTNTEIFAGLVITGSFTPEDTGDPCTSRGSATLYVFDILTGEGYFKDPITGEPDRDLDVGAGLPSDPKTSVGPDGKDNRVYIEKSGTDLESIESKDISLESKGLYWRELP